MFLLNSEESSAAANSFIHSVYGEEVFQRWKELKEDLGFTTEREYVLWMLEVADAYRMGEICAGGSSDGGTEAKTFGTVRESGDLYHEQEHNPVQTEDIHVTTIDVEHLDTATSPLVAAADRKLHVVSDVCEVDDVYPCYKVEPQRPSPVLVVPGGDYDPRKMFHCSLCSYATDRKGHLKRHVLCIHEHCKKYACHYCDYSATLNTSLKRHLINKHGYESKFRCCWCGKGMVAQASLDKHERACGKQQQQQQITAT